MALEFFKALMILTTSVPVICCKWKTSCALLMEQVEYLKVGLFHKQSREKGV